MSSLFITAIPLSSVGAIIPYMAAEAAEAAEAGIDETYYSIIFVMISISILIGAILYKALGVYQHLSKHHTIMLSPVWRSLPSAWLWST
jgi:hypothetical protein